LLDDLQQLLYSPTVYAEVEVSKPRNEDGDRANERR